MRSTIQNPLALVLVSALLATVAGCGGSDDDDSAAPSPPPAPPPPEQITLQGSAMRKAALQNAVVCMDLNANSACDGNEPASAPTDANGVWSLTYKTAEISADQVASASLIALVTPATTDAGRSGESATTQSYVLRQVPGKSGQINPLTTLVAKGMADGMTEAMARSNAALQLGIAEAKIDDYQDDPAAGAEKVQDNARTLASFTASALEAGAVLQVGDQMAAQEASTSNLIFLAYTDSANYTLRYSNILAKAAGSSNGLYSEQRASMAGGVAITNPAALYPNAYLTPSGWKRCTADTQHIVTAGNPSRDLYCDTKVSVSYWVYSNIAGKSMASVIQDLQAAPVGNTINNGVATDTLIAALGSAVFPEGSQVRHRTGLNLSQPLMINNTNTDARPRSEATNLEELIAAKQAPPGDPATIPANTLTLGITTSALRNLRVAFTGTTNATDGTVQFYECDLNEAQTVASNCLKSNTGTYHIDTIHGVRVMRFEGHGPTPASTQDNFYAELKTSANVDYVFRVRQTQPTLALARSVANRLDGTAWKAMRAQLGL